MFVIIYSLNTLTIWESVQDCSLVVDKEKSVHNPHTLFTTLIGGRKEQLFNHALNIYGVRLMVKDH